MKPKRVLLVIENLPLARDHRARKQSAALTSYGYDVTVVCRRDARNAAFARSAGVGLYEFPARPAASSKVGFVWAYGFSLLACFATCLRASRQGRFDVVQVANPPDAQFLLAAPFKWFGCALIVDQRDLSPEAYAARYGSRDGLLYRLVCRIERSAWRAADHIVTVNTSLANIVVERGRHSMSSVTVVGSGPDRDRNAIPNPALKCDRRYLVMWLGLMGPHDHADMALVAARHVIDTLGRRDCHFIFVGAGEDLPWLQSLSEELGIGDFVTFTGWLDEPQFVDVLATADVALDSNMTEELTPVKGLEYMSFGLPMVAFNLRGTRAMAGEAAAYVTPGDTLALAAKVVQLLDDEPQRARMGAVGRRRIEESLAWEYQQARYLDVYSSLVGDAAMTERRVSHPIPAGDESLAGWDDPRKAGTRP